MGLLQEVRGRLGGRGETIPHSNKLAALVQEFNGVPWTEVTPYPTETTHRQAATTKPAYIVHPGEVALLHTEARKKPGEKFRACMISATQPGRQTLLELENAQIEVEGGRPLHFFYNEKNLPADQNCLATILVASGPDKWVFTGIVLKR